MLIDVDDADEFRANSSITSSVEKSYYDAYVIAASVLCVKTTFSSTSYILRVPTATASVLSLPKIELPKFDGSLTQ